MPKVWDKFKYKYLTYFLIGLVIAVFLAGNQSFHDFLVRLGDLEYIGAFFAGLLFVSSFTLPTAIVVIGILAENLNPLLIALIGGIGSVIGDLIIFKYVKNHLTDELFLLFGKEGASYVKFLLKSKYIHWTLPILGALIIASPLPDELGISLLGFSKISQTKFVIISFISNAFGILAVASVAKVL